MLYNVFDYMITCRKLVVILEVIQHPQAFSVCKQSEHLR